MRRQAVCGDCSCTCHYCISAEAEEEEEEEEAKEGVVVFTSEAGIGIGIVYFGTIGLCTTDILVCVCKAEAAVVASVLVWCWATEARATGTVLGWSTVLVWICTGEASEASAVCICRGEAAVCTGVWICTGEAAVCICTGEAAVCIEAGCRRTQDNGAAVSTKDARAHHSKTDIAAQVGDARAADHIVASGDISDGCFYTADGCICTGRHCGAGSCQGGTAREDLLSGGLAWQPGLQQWPSARRTARVHRLRSLRAQPLPPDVCGARRVQVWAVLLPGHQVPPHRVRLKARRLQRQGGNMQWSNAHGSARFRVSDGSTTCLAGDDLAAGAALVPDDV